MLGANTGGSGDAEVYAVAEALGLAVEAVQQEEGFTRSMKAAVPQRQSDMKKENPKSARYRYKYREESSTLRS